MTPSRPARSLAGESGPPAYAPDLACEACGIFGAFRFDGATLCVDCYQSGGSCGVERAEPISPGAEKRHHRCGP